MDCRPTLNQYSSLTFFHRYRSTTTQTDLRNRLIQQNQKEYFPIFYCHQPTRDSAPSNVLMHFLLPLSRNKIRAETRSESSDEEGEDESSSCNNLEDVVVTDSTWRCLDAISECWSMVLTSKILFLFNSHLHQVIDWLNFPLSLSYLTCLWAECQNGSESQERLKNLIVESP